MRIARLTVPGLVHHVVSRFVDRSWFFNEPFERAKYLDLLGRALEQTDWRCLAYALMSNHIHLALVAGGEPPEHWLKRANSPFAAWLNQARDRLGPVFADRPAIWVMRPDYEARLISYLHNNPVRAGVVARARDSGWTSHRIYCGLATAPRWLEVDSGLARCGFTRAQRRDFDRWVDGEHGGGDARVRLEEVRRESRKHGALEVGTPLVGEGISVPLVMRPHGRIWTDAKEIVERVARAVSVPAARFCSRSHKPELVSARRIAVHAATRMGLPLAAIASTLGISAAAASRHAARELDEHEARVIAELCRESYES